jgi:predicted amidophosphoribosyltransferase
MDLNPDKPLCSKCYPIWAKDSDETYPEKYCHICGKESKQSVEKPVCYPCYKKFYK